jgi:hypothetical protein
MAPEKPPKEKHVRIIYVPVDVVLAEMQKNTLGSEPVDTVTLAHVAKHIGAAAPTDIIVFNKQPWHFAGRGSDKQLRAHPQVHHDFPETILVLKPDEEAVWTSDRLFVVTDAKPSGVVHPHPGFVEGTNHPDPYPFGFPKPIQARQETTGTWRVHSGTPSVGAQLHMYKISFSIETDDIDPDVYCGDSN